MQSLWLGLLPVLYAVYPVLFLYSSNSDFVRFANTLAPLAAAAVLAVVAYLVALAALRRADKAAVVSTAAIFLFFFHGHLERLLEGVFDVDLDLAVLLIEAAALAAVVVVVVRAGDLAKVARVLGLVGVGLVTMSLGWVALASVASAGQPRSVVGGPLAAGIEVDAAPRRRPDIYYIVLDGYGREDTLREFIGFDNAPFVAELERRGFYVAKRSRSNYSQTSLSLASSLNLTYLDEFVKSSPPTEESLLLTLRANNLTPFLRANGYDFVNIPSGFQMTDPMLGTDAVARPDEWALTEFEVTVASLTPLKLIFAKLPGPTLEPAARHRRDVLNAFANLPPPGRVAPRFVFAHIVAPHPPFVFAADGAFPPQPKVWTPFDGRTYVGRRPEYQKGYAGQVEYVNGQVLAAIDRIMEQAGPENPPIILVQGDHGPASHYTRHGLNPYYMRERMAILNAYYFPPDVEADLYETISPVNSFRIVLNGVFGTRIPLAPDESYFSTFEDPFVWYQVDERGQAVLGPP